MAAEKRIVDILDTLWSKINEHNGEDDITFSSILINIFANLHIAVEKSSGRSPEEVEQMMAELMREAINHYRESKQDPERFKTVYKDVSELTESILGNRLNKNN